MKKVIWEKEKGWLRCSVLDNEAMDSEAEFGVPFNPPDFRNIDWEEISRKINNRMIEKGLITFQDIQSPNCGLHNEVMSAILPEIVLLYKQQEN